MKWIKEDKDSWTADVGESVPARIKQLDGKTFCVYRGGQYLGSEGDLATAEKRADLNMRSEINREMDWQRAHPNELPLGLRLTQEERALVRGPADKAAPRLAKPKAGGIDPPKTTVPVPKTAPPVPKTKVPDKAAPKPAPDNRDAEILTLLKRGCTSEEVLRVTGWKAVSMPAMAKRLGVGLRIDKGCKPFKYYAEEK